jgi:hypothetical protein
MAKNKKKRKKKGQIVEINVKQRFQNVKILVDTKRPKEAIAYIYLVYTDLINNKHKKPRMQYQTIREYAIDCVTKLELKPQNTYVFIKKIEDIIYGGVEPTAKEFEATIGLFINLHKEITGKAFSFSL